MLDCAHASMAKALALSSNPRLAAVQHLYLRRRPISARVMALAAAETQPYDERWTKIWQAGLKAGEVVSGSVHLVVKSYGFQYIPMRRLGVLAPLFVAPVPSFCANLFAEV